MKTDICAENPFGRDRYGFLYEVLRKQPSKPQHLDYGTFDGAVLVALSKAGVIERGVGLDVNIEALNTGQAEFSGKVKLERVTVRPKVSIDHANDTFDTASVLDVIEHVNDQKTLLVEIHRVLKAGGRLIVTVPKKNIFSFLDMGNLKFRFPRLHRKFYEWKYSKEAYRERYVECKNGLFGDIEKEKMWHQHFSEHEMENLLEQCGFEVVEFDGSGLFLRMLTSLQFFLPGAGKLLDWPLQLDARIFESSNLFCVARKV